MLPYILASSFVFGVGALPALVCQTQSSPNPIVEQYPGDITGKAQKMGRNFRVCKLTLP